MSEKGSTGQSLNTLRLVKIQSSTFFLGEIFEEKHSGNENISLSILGCLDQCNNAALAKRRSCPVIMLSKLAKKQFFIYSASNVMYVTGDSALGKSSFLTEKRTRPFALPIVSKQLRSQWLTTKDICSQLQETL